MLASSVSNPSPFNQPQQQQQQGFGGIQSPFGGTLNTLPNVSPFGQPAALGMGAYAPNTGIAGIGAGAFPNQFGQIATSNVNPLAAMPFASQFGQVNSIPPTAIGMGQTIAHEMSSMDDNDNGMNAHANQQNGMNNNNPSLTLLASTTLPNTTTGSTATTAAAPAGTSAVVVRKKRGATAAECMSSAEVENAFRANEFHLGLIPEIPPPDHLR